MNDTAYVLDRFPKEIIIYDSSQTDIVKNIRFLKNKILLEETRISFQDRLTLAWAQLDDIQTRQAIELYIMSGANILNVISEM